MIDREQLRDLVRGDRPGVLGTLTIGGHPGNYSLRKGLTGPCIVDRGTPAEMIEALGEILLDRKPSNEV